MPIIPQRLLNIHDHIAEENLIAAQKVINEIYGKTQILKDYPQLGYC